MREGSSSILFQHHSIRYRLATLEAKRQGYYADISWRELLRLLPQSTDRWPREKLVRLLETRDGLGRFATPGGEFWAREEDAMELGLTAIEILGGAYAFAGARVAAGDVVFDLGANAGFFSRIALQLGAAKVYAFEANPVYQECLRRSFREEIAAGRLEIVPHPVWSETTTVRFAGDGLIGHIALEGRELQAVSLDDFLERHGVARVHLLKADIEGAERHALQGARKLLQRDRPKITFCTYHLPDDVPVINGLLGEDLYPRRHLDSSGRYLYCW